MVSRNSDDLYDLMELSDLRWRATEDQIKKAFRKMSLQYHPDKVGAREEKDIIEAEEHFKKIIKAYDTLSDRKKRAAYDSIDEVDDSIPSERSINDKNFYSVFNQVKWKTGHEPAAG